jgi:hypothetical protein
VRPVLAAVLNSTLRTIYGQLRVAWKQPRDSRFDRILRVQMLLERRKSIRLSTCCRNSCGLAVERPTWHVCKSGCSIRAIGARFVRGGRECLDTTRCLAHLVRAGVVSLAAVAEEVPRFGRSAGADSWGWVFVGKAAATANKFCCAI